MRLIVATHNINKIKEIREILSDFDIEISSMAEIGIQEEIPETGKTIEENALVKARALKNKTEGLIMADDTGLFVDYLNGNPGVYSARFAGENATYEDNNMKLLKMLEGVPFDKRTAHFKTVIALLNKDKETVIEGRLDGRILYKQRGKNGFGYDPIFYVDEAKKTLAEMTLEEKNTISHRARALNKLKSYLYKTMGDKE
ncbi:XTP/dITP diphosphatase [Aceticella autotrophica]|uniref:dITP/XTP pyrophosphatase n=1 Tax=Aceticella autotrophica TaxID=2755338 RepID=A0A975G9S4_9THEO|nr:XTP/dITP diphosphatase [Aceticella autotrophica]QSZ26919.1 XTP/dITP diphosphatase [Aceticella autotrophica]